jgi:deoxyribonuclease V
VTAWPETAAALVAAQHDLARAARVALVSDPWVPSGTPLIGGCFVVFARGEAGPGHAGDHAWAGAVVWAPDSGVVAEAVVAGRVPAAYSPGLLALREGPVLAEALERLAVRPDVVLIDATGLDHPRGAGLAVHLGAVLGVPTVGVTHRPLAMVGVPPELLRRGAHAALALEGEPVAAWVCTRTGARPVVAHAAWRTSVETAIATVLRASTEAARTPVPLQAARHVARARRACAV